MLKHENKPSEKRSPQKAGKRKRGESACNEDKRRSRRINQPNISKDRYHRKGTRVSVKWHSGKKYTGTVTSVSKSSPRMHTVTWDGDGAETINLRYAQLRRVKI